MSNILSFDTSEYLWLNRPVSNNIWCRKQLKFEILHREFFRSDKIIFFLKKVSHSRAEYISIKMNNIIDFTTHPSTMALYVYFRVINLCLVAILFHAITGNNTHRAYSTRSNWRHRIHFIYIFLAFLCWIAALRHTTVRHSGIAFLTVRLLPYILEMSESLQSIYLFILIIC